MERIASFSVDHLLLEPGVYVSRIDRDPATGAAVTTSSSPTLRAMSPVPLPRSAATTWTRTFPWQTGSRAATSTATWPISTRSTCTTSRRKDCLLLLNRSHGDIDRLTV